MHVCPIHLQLISGKAGFAGLAEQTDKLPGANLPALTALLTPNKIKAGRASVSFERYPVATNWFSITVSRSAIGRGPDFFRAYPKFPTTSIVWNLGFHADNSSPHTDNVRSLLFSIELRFVWNEIVPAFMTLSQLL